MNKILIEILVVLIVILLLFLGLLHPIWMVGVILLFFLGFHLYIYGGIFWGGMRLRKLLSKNGRVITLKEAKKKVSQSEGTIIVEAPTLGCNVNRLWWSPDVDIKNNKEFLGDQQDYIHEACENYDKYISEETGSAKLFDVFVLNHIDMAVGLRH